jgi:hypothetical protein
MPAASGVPWGEVGTEAGKRLLSLAEAFRSKLRDALQQEPGEHPLAVGDLDSARWKYEACLFIMFFHWYVAYAPKLREAGATGPFFDAYYRTCHRVLFEELLEPGEENARRLESDIAERFKAYEEAWRVDLSRDIRMHPLTGEIGWVFARHVSDSQEVDPRFALLIRMVAGEMFIHVTTFIHDVEGVYRRKG